MYAVPIFLLVLIAIGVGYYIFYQFDKYKFEKSLNKENEDQAINQKLDRDQLVNAITERNETDLLVEKALLQTMANEIKGATLQEVVEKYAKVSALAPPSLVYDKDVALIYKNNITKDEEQNVDLLIQKIKRITADNNLVEGSHDIYLAYNTYEALRVYALDLTLATKVMKTRDEAVDYLFETWLKIVPTHYVVPILFPPSSKGKVEEFAIDKEMRFAMIDGLFARLQSAENFRLLITDFAEENPYFREYPL